MNFLAAVGMAIPIGLLASGITYVAMNLTEK